jgi:hypothetical protein
MSRWSMTVVLVFRAKIWGRDILISGVTSRVSVEVIAGIRARLPGRDLRDVVSFFRCPSGIGMGLSLGGATSWSHPGLPTLSIEI